ncbi:MAG: hypothetical protein ACPHDV_04290, partial [Parvibaculales bacterium]
VKLADTARQLAAHLGQAGAALAHLGLDVAALRGERADALVEFGLINKRDKRKLLLLGGLGAALGGDTQDRLSLPLRFQNKRLYLGRLELGAAPKWQ